MMKKMMKVMRVMVILQPRSTGREEPEDAVGKIVIVEMHEKRKNSLFPALVSYHSNSPLISICVPTQRHSLKFKALE